MKTKNIVRAFLLLGWSILSLESCGKSPPSDSMNIFGPDNREAPPNGQPYDAIGRIDSGCTGTLVGRRLVLTAAHCIIDSSSGAVKSTVRYFRPALKNGSSSSPSWINYIWLGTITPESERIRDWAILRLDDDRGSQFGTVGVQDIPIADQIPYTTNLIGYSSDRQNGDDAGLHRGCYIHEVADGRLFHDCDGSSGISGAPLINWIQGIPSIIGITVSEFRQGAATSVHRESYSRDYANVAIPTSSFKSTWQTLLLTQDAGISSPTMDGVHDLPNPNSRVENPSPSPNPDPPNPVPPNPPRPTWTADNLVTLSELQSRESQLIDGFDNLREGTFALGEWAEHFNNRRVLDLALDLGDAGSSFEAVIRHTIFYSTTDYQGPVFDAFNGTEAVAFRLKQATFTDENAINIDSLNVIRANIAHDLDKIVDLIFRGPMGPRS